MIRLRRVALLLVCLPAFLGCQGPPALTQGLGAKIWVGRYQEIEEYSEDRRVRERVWVRSSQSDPLHVAARWAFPQDGLAFAASRDVPRLLGELQSRHFRV